MPLSEPQLLSGLEEIDPNSDDLLIDQALVEKMIFLLQEDPNVNYDVLLTEQLKEFYLL